MFLGEDIGAWLVLALGAAMAAGHVAALLRPPPESSSHGAGSATDAAGDPKAGPGSKSEPEARGGPGDPAAGRAPRRRSPVQRRAPLARSILFICVGLLAAVWAFASLVS